MAIIDTGVNPYHDAFRAHPNDLSVDDYPLVASGAEMVNLSLNGTYEERLAADEAFWAGAAEGRLTPFLGQGYSL